MIDALVLYLFGAMCAIGGVIWGIVIGGLFYRRHFR